MLGGDRGLRTEIPVTIATRGGEKIMLCEPPDPRLWRVRAAAIFGLQLLAAVPSLL